MEASAQDSSLEETCWRAAVRGDAEAFGSIFDRHQPRVYGHACRLVDVRADAEDVTATAFLELWRRREHVRVVGGSVLPWLLVTATNVSRNVRRSTRRHRALLDRLPRDAVAPDLAQVVERELPLGWDVGLVHRLRELSSLDLALVSLVALEGLPIADAADAVGVSVSAAKSRLHRLRAGRHALVPVSEGSSS